MGIKKELRLKKEKDIKRLLEKGYRLKSRYFTIIFLENSLDYSRIGIFVKSPKNSVERNKIKRHVREVFRSFVKYIKPVDIIVIHKREAKDLTFLDKKRILWEMLKNGKIIKKDSSMDFKILSAYIFFIFSIFL